MAASACFTEEPTEARRADFDDLFEEVDRVVLEESADDPIVRIGAVLHRPSGGFLLVDEVGHKVRLFDAEGQLERALGGPGDGPGELDTPTAAVELVDGRVFVTQRANRRLTVFDREEDPFALTGPGLYGWWLADTGNGLIIGVGSRADRFVLTDYTADSLASFGPLDPEVNEIPFWIYYARESATLFGDAVAINTSFYPTVRLFSPAGDSIGIIGSAPTTWIQAGPPPVSRADSPEARDAVVEWSKGFSVVAGLAGLDDGPLVVQYGRHAPYDQDLYAVQPTALDVYSAEGVKLAADVTFAEPVVGGGPELLVLVGEPPEPWTVARYRWLGDAGS